MATNTLDGFAMEGKPVGHKLEMDVGGTVLLITSFSCAVVTSNNDAFIEGEVSFEAVGDDGDQDPGGALVDSVVESESQFDDDSVFTDDQNTKVAISITSEISDGEVGVSLDMTDAVVHYRGGIMRFKTKVMTAVYKSAVTADFDSNDTARVTDGGSLAFEAGH